MTVSEIQIIHNFLSLTLITQSTVSDLSVGSMDFTASTFEIKFTWPGKQLDIGKVADFKVRAENVRWFGPSIFSASVM